MPWHTVKDSAECPSSRPWAVVKDSDGSVEGCHQSEEDANDQMAALYSAEKDAGLAELTDEVVQLAAMSDTVTMATEEGDKEKAEELEGPFAPWDGVLALEGTETGDGREFAPESLEWPDPPLPLSWQRESEPQHGHSVVVGRIDTLERQGTEIRGRGVLDIGSEAGAELARQLKNGFAGGVSVDVDSVKDADVELVFPLEEDTEGGEDEDGVAMLFGPPPDKVVFHRGRIRGATLVALPAFVEARIQLSDEDSVEQDALVAALTMDSEQKFGAIASHSTGTTDGKWDGLTEANKLPTPMPVGTARKMYGWMEDGSIENGEIRKHNLKFPHHEVSSDGTPGAANLTACSGAIGTLNGARFSPNIPASDRKKVYDHLAKHIRDAGKEPPELLAAEDVITASAATDVAPLYPPLEWFQNPNLTRPTAWTVDEEGRVYGHLALWGTCHTTFADRCVTPPREKDYAYYLRRELKTREGGIVGVGQITLGTGHAAARCDAAPAAAHYDNTGFCAADVCVGEDNHGIWVAGSLRPTLSEHRVREFRAASLSGDWRRIGGRLRLVAVLAVNVPGYPVPRMHARMDSDDLLALTAAGIATPERVERLHQLQTGDGYGTLKVRKVKN